MKIAKIFATGISGDIRSEFTVYNVKDVKTIKLTDQCKCYQFLGCEKGKAQAIYLHKTSDVFFRLIPDIEDIITFGSPCQDMSIAGKRAGLKHADIGDEETTRSGLFLEAIRIIKEMREATNGGYPRYAVWENVPGAFSSNKGEDFRTVLDELIKISEPDAVMPAVPQAGWAYADCISGDGWSIAYRVFDAQYWGVPQRRRRIYLVADFRGECAQEILF